MMPCREEARPIVQEGSMTHLAGSCLYDVRVLQIEGPLHAPLKAGLRHIVRALLRRGQRTIVLDLAGVPDIDAKGVGELVRTYNMTNAVNGTLQIVHATTWVREILDRARLLDLLSAADSSTRAVRRLA
jgi:anti-anti-sigma factor